VGITRIGQHERCVVQGCTGVKAPPLDVCFVHADDVGFARAFSKAGRSGEVDLDLRGTPLTQWSVDRILQACETDADGLRRLRNVDARATRPSEPLTIAGASFNRLQVDELTSEHGVELDVTVRTYMSMFNLRCAELKMCLAGDGKVICDSLQAGAQFRLTFKRFTSSVRGSPLLAEHVFIGPSLASLHASVHIDAVAESCSLSGGKLARVEIRQARVRDELSVTAVDVTDGIWLTDTTAGDLELNGCRSTGIDLSGVRVAGDLQAAHLDLGSVWANDCLIAGEAVFRDVTAKTLTTGQDASFGLLDLAGCSITDHLSLTDTTFTYLALDNAELARASLSSIVVEGHASLRAAKVSGPLLIADSELAGSLSLNGVVAEDVTLRGIDVADALGLFRTQVARDLRVVDVGGARIADLRELRVGEAAELDVSADRVDMRGCTIAGALRLRAETPMLQLASASLMARGEVECEGPPGHLCALDLQAVEPRERLLVDGRDRTSVVDLRRARCDGVRLQAVALDRCLFDGATGLEEMRLTGESFARRARRPARGRVVLAEDADFDGDLLPGRDDALVPEADAILSQRRAASASQMAQRYRSLRKGLEDSKDSAGASEFYFAEMHMRRADPGTSGFERRLLWAYRMFGGYGVRPLAPALWLLVLLVIATTGATALGAVNRLTTPAQHIALAPQDCRLRAGQQAMRLRCPATTGTIDAPETGTERNAVHVGLVVASSAFGFTRSLDGRLEPAGQAIIIVVRLLGAVLLGLLALALRSAVRR